MNSIKKEIWKNVPNYEGCYMSSNMGRVKSLSRHVASPTVKHPDRLIYKEGRILKPVTGKKGYDRVQLPKGKTITVHRIICLTFIKNPNNYPQINHINSIKNDNRVENLEWCNNSMNQVHAFANGLQSSRRGMKANRSKLTDKDIEYIRKSNKSNPDLAKELNVGRCSIWRVRVGLTWTHI